jgi:hypothetical protein
MASKEVKKVVRLLKKCKASVLLYFTRCFKRCHAAMETTILPQHPEAKETELGVVLMFYGCACSFYFGLLW